MTGYVPDAMTGYEWVNKLTELQFPIEPVIGNSSVIPSSITVEDYERLVFLEVECQYYRWITGVIRSLGKGAGLLIKDGMIIGADVPPDISEMTALYDRRIQNNGLFGALGLLISNRDIRLDGKNDDVVFSVSVNYDETEISFMTFGGDRSPERFWRPRMMPLLLSIEAVRQTCIEFHDPIQDAIDIDPLLIIDVLVACSINEMATWNKNPKKHAQVMQMGYSLHVSYEALMEWTQFGLRVMGARNGKTYSHDEIEQALDWLTVKGDAGQSIDLWDRIGFKFVHKYEYGYLLDWHSVQYILVDLLSPIASLTSADGNKKAGLFVDALERKLLEKGLNVPIEWKGKQISIGGVPKGDTDLVCIIRDIFIVIECKAWSVTRSYDAGDPDHVIRRVESFNEAIDQVDGLCELIASNASGLNIIPPVGCSKIYGLIASPFAEYIPEKSDRWFHSEDVPRVLTADELVDVLKNIESCGQMSHHRVLNIDSS